MARSEWIVYIGDMNLYTECRRSAFFEVIEALAIDRCNSFLNYLHDSGMSPLGFVRQFIVMGSAYTADPVASDIEKTSELYHQSPEAVFVIDETPYFSNLYHNLSTQLTNAMDSTMETILQNRYIFPNGVEIEVLIHSPSIDILMIVLEIRGNTFI